MYIRGAFFVKMAKAGIEGCFVDRYFQGLEAEASKLSRYIYVFWGYFSA